VLANATAVRNLPGRKSDVSDAQWLADLLAHGLVRGSFVPPAPIQALRELTRTRKQLGREVTAHSQRIEKVLESADVKLATVLRPLLGVSGRAIVAALAAGETDPDRLATAKTITSSAPPTSSAATTPASSPVSHAVCTTSATRSPSAPLHEVLGGASYLVAADPARGAVFLVEETGVVARCGSSAYRRGALGAKTVASMVPSCPIGSMVPGGLRLLHW
jgi:hypothetical protein